MIMITGWQVEIFYLGDFRNYVVDNLSKAQIRTQNRSTSKLYSILQPTRFFLHGKSFIRIIAQIKHINQTLPEAQRTHGLTP